MERLTKHSKQTSHENGICCTHFYGPECLEVGGNCAMNCKWEEAAWSRLAAYEDTGLTPEEIKAPFTEDTMINLAAQALGVEPSRLRELAEADKDGRVIILPCKVYETDGVRVYEHTVREVIYETAGGPAFDKNAIGKSIFLTRAEAERAIQVMEGKG